MGCKHKFGCHECLVEKAADKMMELYHALGQFVKEPEINKERALLEAVSLRREISSLIVTDDKETENESCES